MIGIRIDNEPELKIEDALQVKGRACQDGYCILLESDHEKQS